MTSFPQVRRATCKVVAAGRTVGSAFVVHPEGYALTCHHVLYGRDAIEVRFADRAEPVTAGYVADWSDPARDVAVLHIEGAGERAVQLGRPRDGTRVDAIGFRPREEATEPHGHTFSGTLGPGQRLRLGPPAEAVARIAAGPPRPWNALPEEAREGMVHNFAGAVGLVPGVSGGPVYDRGLRRVVGMLRAVEGGALGYVISMVDAFDAWSDLEQTNRRAVPDGPLDVLGSYGVALVEETARLPVMPRGRAAFAELRRRHRLFGGRAAELERLDEAGDGYTFITGPAGFGKTALLANWIEALERHGDPLAFHFITPGIDDASEEFLLENLCQQLLAVHGLAGDLPANARGLRFLYADLLRVPPADERPVTVVVDGLDEAVGRWEPRSELFPPDLAEGVRVVFSARTMADRDWPAQVGMELPAERVMMLGRLSRGAVADVLARSGTADDGLANRIFELSEGDPFYVQDLLDELQRAGPEALADLPIGHSAYLRQWWLDGLRRAGTEAFADLLGTLAVARSPLTRRQLLVVGPDDALTGATFDVLIAVAARYVDGTDAGGYELRHGRIRAFVSDRLADQISTYRERLARYCLRWDKPELDARESEYMLAHAAEHLAEAGCHEALMDLLGPRWFAAKWKRHGSYSALVADFDVAAAAALTVEPPEAAAVAALTIARQTIRELMLDLPIELLLAWTRLGEVDRVYALLDVLTDVKGLAAEPLIRVATAMAESGEHSEDVERLLEQAVAMLPLVRSSNEKVEQFGAVAALVRDAALEDAARERLLEQLTAFARAQSEPALQAIAFWLVADAASHQGGDGLARAAALAERAEEAPSGEVDRADAPLDAPTVVNGRAAEPLIRVAAAMAESREHSDLIERLLGRAVAMLPLLRSSNEKVEQFGAVAALVRDGALEDAAQERLLEQLTAFARAQSEPALRAVALGLAADAAGHRGGDGLARAAALVEEAEEAIRRIDFPPDRLLASACLLGARRSLDPATVADAAAAALGAAPDPFQASSLKKQPITVLLKRWAPVPEDGAAAEALLHRLGAEASARDEGYVAGRVAHTWARFGRPDNAFALIKGMREASPVESSAAAMTAAEALAEADPAEMRELLDLATVHAAPDFHDMPINRELFAGNVAGGWAHLGEWDRAIAMLESIEAELRADPLTTCVRIALREVDADPSPVLARLLGLVGGASAGHRAGVEAAAADSLARGRPDLARSHAVAAARTALGDLPEGDTDELRRLVALALDEDGDLEGAVRIARDTTWAVIRVQTIAAMIERRAASADEGLGELTTAVLDAVRAAEGAPLFEDALTAGAAAARQLAAAAPDATRQLCAYAESAPRDQVIPHACLRTLATAAAALTRIDTVDGLAAFERAVEVARSWQRSGYEIGHLEAMALIEGYAPALEVAPDDVRSALESARAVAEDLDGVDVRIELQCAFARAIAAVDAPAAADIIREQIARVDDLALVEAPAPHLQRIIAEFTGRLMGTRKVQADAAEAVVRATCAAAEALGAEAAPLLADALAAIERIESPPDRAQALHVFIERCPARPPDPGRGEVYREAVAAAGELGDPSLTTHALEGAAELARGGYADAAQLAVEVMPIAESRDRLRTAIDAVAEEAQLGELSAFERAYMAIHSDLAAAVLHSVRIEGTAAEVLQALLEPAGRDEFPWERGRLMSEWLPLLAAPVRALSGTAAVVDILELVEDFDRRLRQTAALIT